AVAAAERANAGLSRYETLFAAGAITAPEIEQAGAAAVRAGAALEAARAELAAAEAAARITPGGNLPVPAVLRAPASGRVLTVHRMSEGAVNPGEPRIEIGTTCRIKVRADVLSDDAVRLHPGTGVESDNCGGSMTLQPPVTRLEPDAIINISALGLQEQRVPV